MAAPVFIRNAWYVAAWGDAIGEGLHEQTIIGDTILLFRDSGGTAHALANICPHRFAPLDRGARVNDIIRCPYHGLGFNPAGACVHNPNGDGRIPGRASLRVYPLVERHAMLWVWLGEPELADADNIPDFSCHTDPALPTVKGVLDIDAYYELITDNLLDLTHAVTVHAGLLGSDAIARGRNTVKREADTVWSNSWCADGLAPPAWDAMFGHFGKPVDHWLNMRWDAPAHMLLDVGVSPVGAPRSEGIWIYGTDILTPVDSGRTRYFWAISRAHDIADEAVGAQWAGAIDHAFSGQDKPIIEAQQRNIRARGGLDIDDFAHAALPGDAGPVQVRRHLRKLATAGAEPPRPAASTLAALIACARTSVAVEPVV